MIHEEICTYEVCKLAKAKRFPQHPNGSFDCCYYHWDRLRKIHSLCSSKVYYDDEFRQRDLFRAPTQSLLQRWLREEKGITICVDIFDDGWFFDISTFYKQDTGVYEVDIPYKSSNVSHVFDSYELALEDALKYALENLV